MSNMVKCSGNVPKVLIELMKKRVEQESLDSTSAYIRNTLMRHMLEEKTYEEYRKSQNPNYVKPFRGPDNAYCLLDIDTYMENCDLSQTEKIHFTLTQEIMDWLDKESAFRELNKTRLIVIFIMREIADYNAYLNYRSLFDKKWLYQYHREVFHCLHEDDPDRDTSTIPDEDRGWDPTDPSYDPNFHAREPKLRF